MAFTGIYMGYIKLYYVKYIYTNLALNYLGRVDFSVPVNFHTYEQ